MQVDQRTGRLAVRLLPTDPKSAWKLLRHENLRPSALQVLDTDAQCAICLDEASDENGVLVRACSCRNEGGGMHIGCCAKAFAAQSRGAPTFPSCPTCKTHYAGKVAVTILLTLAAATAATAAAAAAAATSAAVSAAASSTATAASANVAAAEAHTALEFGTRVLIEGLRNATHLNGAVGAVIDRAVIDRAVVGGEVGSEVRWLVQLRDGSIKAIREANLRAHGHTLQGAGSTDSAAGAGQSGGVVPVVGDLQRGDLQRGADKAADVERILGVAYRAAGQHAMSARCLRTLVARAYVRGEGQTTSPSHAYMHTHIHAYIHPHMHACMHTYIRAYIYACLCREEAGMHAYIHTCIPAERRQASSPSLAR